MMITFHRLFSTNESINNAKDAIIKLSVYVKKVFLITLGWFPFLLLFAVVAIHTVQF